MSDKNSNNFVTKLKAHGSENDYHDLDKAYHEYSGVLNKLPSREKPSFSLNVLCILCRNLEKVPSWRKQINNKDLLKLCIDCVRQTRGQTGEPRVKTLAAIYHVHKYIVKQNTSVPPELVLKISIMPFECDTPHLLKDYHKTYWSILADRINYIERLKPLKIPIIKLLPKLNEDLTKVITLYTDGYDFCLNLLPFIIKKLTYIYVDISLMELNETYRIIFDGIKVYESKFKELNDKQLTEVYVKFNECVCVVAENSTKIDFKDSPLDDILRVCLMLLGHRPDIFHCLQTFYMNSFLFIFNRHNDSENVFKNMLMSCETTEKLGYKSLINVTYPFLSHLLRICIEYYQKKKVSEQMQENCLNFILFLMVKVTKCKQIIKCENCTLQSGLHDALRLSFLVKNILNNANSTKIKLLYAIIDNQYQILKHLNAMGCINHEKYYTKLQTDVHNIAIQFYKSQTYDCSIKLFDIYIKNELDNQFACKNISRALYNKSICELDKKLYDIALKDAFLSMVFDKDTNMEKYMSLVLDIKGKAVQSEVDGYQELQLLSVVGACSSVVEGLYGNLEGFLKELKFSELLKQEFSMYEKLWPSLIPITGVIRSLNDMISGKYQWMLAEDVTILRDMLYDMILKTAGIVRTIQEANFKETVKELIDNMEYDDLSLDEKIAYISLLMLKSEHDIQDATERHGWKPTEHFSDPNQSTIYRTLPQEYDAAKESVRAVELLTTLKTDLRKVSPKRLNQLVELCGVPLYQLLHMERTLHGLELAHIGLHVADFVGNHVSYVRFAGVLLCHSGSQSAEMCGISARAVKLCGELVQDKHSVEAALVFLCELGIYYIRCQKSSIAARILRKVEVYIARAYKNHPGVQLDLALGKAMEVGTLLSEREISLLSAVNCIQRHYITVQPSGTTWLSRRRYSLQIRHSISQASARCTDVCRRLKLWRRGATAAGAALAPTGAGAHGRMFAHLCDTSRPDDAQIKIDNRLKHILGLTQEIKHQNIDKNIKTPPKTPKYETLEVSLNCLTIGQLSPSLPCVSVPAFTVPEFLDHANCICYACNMPACVILACTISYLEASMYFRSKQHKIAKNYFRGATETFRLAEAKLQMIFKNSNEFFEKNIVDFVKKQYFDELKSIEIDFLIEYAFFELSEGNFDQANAYIVKMHEIISERNIDPYIKNEVTNLLIATYWLTKPTYIPTPKTLEIEFENLKITTTDAPKTPETKTIPKKDIPKMVKDDEIPKKRKVIKLNLDEVPEDQTPQKSEKPKFKVPEPMVAKPNLENITPRATRSRPHLVVTQPDTPQFFTPKSTPNEKFFTPVAKTYSRKIVKNLETEFSTPSEPTQSLRKKSLLKRATSPGKLASVTRSRRVKQPDFDDK